MRLTEIEYLLRDIDTEKYKLISQNVGDGNIKLSNINNFKYFIEKIMPIDAYFSEVSRIMKTELYKTTADELSMSYNKAIHVINKASYLVNSVEALQRVLANLLPQSTEDSVTIKLPEPSDFKDLLKTMETFEKSISTIIVDKDIGGSLKINNWEHGSFWIELMLGTSAAVGVVSQIAWSGAVISKKYTENKIFALQAKKMEIETSSLEDILEKQKRMTAMLVETEAKAIEDKLFTTKDNERVARLKHSIKTFAELIGKGAEVHPSLMAPETVKNLFPDFKQLENITSQVKQIEDHTGDTPTNDTTE